MITATSGIAPFAAYPSLELSLSPAEPALACALFATALVPFADRKGIAP